MSFIFSYKFNVEAFQNGKKISDAEKKQGLRQGLAKRMELAVQYTEPFYERRIAIQVKINFIFEILTFFCLVICIR